MSNSSAGNVYYRRNDFDRAGSSSDAYNNDTPPQSMPHSSRNSLTQKSVFQKHNANIEKSESSSKYSRKQQFSKQQQKTVLETRSATYAESRWKSEKQNPLESNSNDHGSLSRDDRLQQNHSDLTEKAGPHRGKYHPIHEEASSTTWNARESESGQQCSLSVSSARYSEPIVKPKKTLIHKSKTLSRQQPEYHSDSEDVPSKSVSSGKNNIFKEIVNYAKKGKKSIASKSGISRMKR